MACWAVYGSGVGVVAVDVPAETFRCVMGAGRPQRAAEVKLMCATQGRGQQWVIFFRSRGLLLRSCLDGAAGGVGVSSSEDE